MAENESLDLALPGGQRWTHLLDAVRRKKTPQEIAKQIELKLPQALRKAFKEFIEHGVGLEDLIASRDDPAAIRRLVRKCEGHEFAHLFQQTAASCVGDSDRELLSSYIDGVLERFVDQITHRVVGNEWESVTDVKQKFNSVRQLVQPDLERIAQKLDNNHNWFPTVKPRNKQQKAEDNTALLSASLLAGSKK